MVSRSKIWMRKVDWMQQWACLLVQNMEQHIGCLLDESTKRDKPVGHALTNRRTSMVGLYCSVKEVIQIFLH